MLMFLWCVWSFRGNPHAHELSCLARGLQSHMDALHTVPPTDSA